MRTLKVYGWTGSRRAAYKLSGNRHPQTREIVAAHSWAEAERLYGGRIARDFASITGNVEETAQALARPGVVFWRPLDHRQQWQEAAPGESV